MSTTIANRVQAFYNQVGEYFSHTRGWLWPEMLPYLNILKTNDTVLDIGCGNGRLLQGIKKQVTYVGVDFSSLLLTQARKLHPGSVFIQGDILDPRTWEKLPRARALFCVAVMHHIPQDKLLFLFTQFATHLEKGGFVYVSTWNLWQKKYLKYHLSWQSVWEKVKTWQWRSVLVPFQKTHWRYCLAYSHPILKKIARKANLRLETAFFSDGTSYWSGKNLVQVYRKV